MSRIPRIVQDGLRGPMLSQLDHPTCKKGLYGYGVPSLGVSDVSVFEAEQSLTLSMLFPPGLGA
jgi:hypothetical protein